MSFLILIECHSFYLARPQNKNKVVKKQSFVLVKRALEVDSVDDTGFFIVQTVQACLEVLFSTIDLKQSTSKSSQSVSAHKTSLLGVGMEFANIWLCHSS